MATNLFILRENCVDRINYLPDAFFVQNHCLCPHTKKELRKVIDSLGSPAKACGLSKNLC